MSAEATSGGSASAADSSTTPTKGDPDGGIPPGTPFEDIPDDWFCPVCGARKRDFTPYDE